jgi:hypothetical protein
MKFGAAQLHPQIIRNYYCPIFFIEGNSIGPLGFSKRLVSGLTGPEWDIVLETIHSDFTLK